MKDAGPPPLPGNTPAPPNDEPSAYNVVTDVAAGPNLRLKDNLFQAIFILVSIAIAAGAGAFIARADPGPAVGAILGGILGLIGGTLLSGGFLMIYRLFKH